MPTEDFSQFPQYQCHKKVWAFKIIGIVQRIGDVLLYSDELPNDPVSVTIPWYLKFQPKVDSYFVAYEDGYTSISPAEPFESGYSVVEETPVVEDTQLNLEIPPVVE